VAPKKCGHTRGKQVVGREEARMRIRAAVDARATHDILIMARTDARAVTGFDDALARCHDFVEEGADIIFLEAPESEAEMRRFCAEIPRPAMANMIDGGKTPILAPDQLEDIGYRIAAYPLVLLSAAIAAMRQALAALRRGSDAPRPPELTFEQLQQAVGFPAYWAAELRYKVD
jgi:2-methylisocitrate lyase-like PEP mutase family enzyme